jgi:hypothetical protein
VLMADVEHFGIRKNGGGAFHAAEECRAAKFPSVCLAGLVLLLVRLRMRALDARVTAPLLVLDLQGVRVRPVVEAEVRPLHAAHMRVSRAVRAVCLLEVPGRRLQLCVVLHGRQVLLRDLVRLVAVLPTVVDHLEEGRFAAVSVMLQGDERLRPEVKVV